MKKTVLILFCVVVLAACNKNQVVPTTVTITSSRILDTLIITDNGITYIDTQSVTYAVYAFVRINEGTGGDFITINVPTTAHFPISVYLAGVPGPAAGTGLYAEAAADSLTNGDSFVEIFSGGEAYNVDSAAINLTSVSQTLVTGTYQLWLSNTGSSKTVSGIIKAHHPVITQ